MKKAVYLDHAAATPIDQRVLKAMSPYLGDNFYNPSALYLKARSVKKDLESARAKIALMLGCRAGEIVFTAGGTEANNLAVKGVMSRYPEKKLLITPLEHESVRQPAGNYKFSEIKIDKYGLVDLASLKKQITDDIVMISVIYASNEVGTIEPIAKVGQLVADIRLSRRKRKVQTPLLLHTDACQAAQYLNLSVNRLGVDLMTLNGGKIYGPKQSAILYVRAGLELMPLIEGGGQEKNRRSGTENVAAAIGIAKALELVRVVHQDESVRISKLREHLRAGLGELGGKIIFHGHPTKRLPNHIAFSIVGKDNEWLMMQLDELGYMVATGSACSASKQEPSRALLSLGVSENDAQSSLRVTLGRSTSLAEIDNFLVAIKAIV